MGTSCGVRPITGCVDCFHPGSNGLDGVSRMSRGDACELMKKDATKMKTKDDKASAKSLSGGFTSSVLSQEGSV